MARNRPKFMESPYFVDTPGNWHLKKGAPTEMQIEFNDYIRSLDIINEPGAIIGNHIDYPYNK